MVGRLIKTRVIVLLLLVIVPLLSIFTFTSPVLAAPVVLINPGSGATGTTVTIQGNNFDSYIGDYVTITFDTMQIPTSPLQIPATGSFATEFTVPETASVGRHWITVFSTGGTVTMLARNFFIVDETLITLDVSEGPVGSEVNVSGQGFYSNRIVSLYYYHGINSVKIGDIVASSTGHFSYDFNVPNSNGGSHKIAVLNDKGNQAEAYFQVIPVILINLSAAGSGQLLAMTGTGFGYRGLVDISIGNHPITTVRTNEFGDFEVVFTIPSIHPGIYEIKAIDEYSFQAKVNFTVTATVGISHTSGPIGLTVTLTGSGFTPKTPVNIDYDGIFIAEVTTDNFGGFITSFNIPVSTGGNHQITVSDGTFTEQYTFTVESDPPTLPRLTIPVKDSATKAMAYLDWQDADDPSQPVVYQLQIASDQNFSTVVIDKPGLANSEYSLNFDEALPASGTGTTYYWRVRATDVAGNESEWSESWSFIVNPPQTPTLVQPELDTIVEIPVFFNWQDVTSLSPPVSYHLQISTDLSFSAIVFEVIGLSDSEYYLSEEEHLSETGEDTPYYWRVKSTDYVQNESKWSDPKIFYIQNGFTFPAWAIYTLIGIAAVLVGYLAYWIGRRGTKKPPE
ncbi:MAG TPA: hypothetical protein G4O16_09560 [Dehalococcoidia bacterium]|nr:hypothetical protein [Dehalococcoidia bacterium]